MALAMTSPARADHVERRGSEPALDGDIKVIDDNGVTITSSTGVQRTVTWDRIRTVTSDDPSLQAKVKEYADTALMLWRARTRLERGDTALADPLFERLFATYRGRRNETALIVAEGLLRCRLARSANDASVIPALECTRLRRRDLTTVAYQTLPGLFDEATGLCTSLPPVWPVTSGLNRLENDLKTYDAEGDATVASLALLYRAAAQRELGQALDAPTSKALEKADEQPGVTLMQMLVRAAAPDADQRASARTALEKRMPEFPEWARAWARFAIGDSLLRESGLGQQERGLVNLASIPASSTRQQPYLAAMALARISGMLARMGDGAGAAAMRAELDRIYPNMPAWQPVNVAARDQPAAPESAASQPDQRPGKPS